MENFKILEEKENQLFNRKEIQVSIEAEVTPSNSDIEKLISEKFSTQIENIKIKKILGKFGSKTFTVFANIYASKEDKENIEPKSKKKSAEGEVPEETTQPETPSQPVEAPATETQAPAKEPAQEQAENKEEEKKEEAEHQELAKPDEEPTQENKVEEKAE